jgi:hypothetical protein
MNRKLSFVTIALLTMGVASTAIAADDDVVACEGKAEGDTCEDADGEQGTCQPDGADSVLECEDAGPDDEEVACEGKAEGDACEEADGETGTCQVDDESSALECEDGTDDADDTDADDTGEASSELSGAGCTASGAGPGGGVAFASLLAALLFQRGRKGRARSQLRSFGDLPKI